MPHNITPLFFIGGFMMVVVILLYGAKAMYENGYRDGKRIGKVEGVNHGVKLATSIQSDEEQRMGRMADKVIAQIKADAIANEKKRPRTIEYDISKWGPDEES